MELFTIVGIGISELMKSIWNRKFDTLSFWTRCMKVNVIYAKFFQAIALHYDLNTEINMIPYSENEICYPQDIPVKGVIGSGVISIVFEGELNGVPIVVKTKRKNIEQRVTSTLESIGRWIHRFHRIYACPILLQSYEDICENFKTQLDFVSEYNNQLLFTEIYKDLPYVKIPTLYKEWCTADQLVMTKLEGIPIGDLSEEEKITTVTWMSKICMHGLMKHGYGHSDLHAGNLIFNREWIGMIDFGFILKLCEEDKNNLYQLLREFSMDNLEEAALYTTHLTSPIEIQEQLTVEELKDITNFIIHVYKNATSVHRFFSVYDILQINKKLAMYDLSISSTFYKIVISLNSLEGVFNKLAASTSDFIICAIMDMD
jgi:predicted unusual protein kinase regulating ubiquinone biosynthesis (AarF/ABC1/UbiB family)